MKILFIAPLPPPLTGHSLASEVLAGDLSKFHQVERVNLSKGARSKEAQRSNRAVEVAKILLEVSSKRRGNDVLYLTISESLGGNLKDLLIYTICRRSLSKMYIHLHGGSIGRLLFDRYKMLSSLNKMFIARLAGVIISGDSHLPIFDGVIPSEKIHVVPNFANDDLFVTEEQVVEKFSKDRPLRVLYISGLEQKKGYNDLAEAYLNLDETLQESIRIDFAGRFDDPEENQNAFLRNIARAKQMHYHGIVDNATKLDLFSRAHAFCLPTSHLEGQPISILEAYAAGCVVLTTTPPGILDIFRDGENGLGIASASPQTIKSTLEKMVQQRDRLLEIGLNNNRTASEKYRSSTFNRRLRQIIESQPASFALQEAAHQST